MNETTIKQLRSCKLDVTNLVLRFYCERLQGKKGGGGGG